MEWLAQDDEDQVAFEVTIHINDGDAKETNNVFIQALNPFLIIG